jgi:hypothetical protein
MNVNNILIYRHIIPLEKIDAENVFYWNWICSRCKVQLDIQQAKSIETGHKDSANKEATFNYSKKNCELEETRQDETGLDMSKKIMSENLLDELLPTLTEYCDYIYQ